MRFEDFWRTLDERRRQEWIQVEGTLGKRKARELVSAGLPNDWTYAQLVEGYESSPLPKPVSRKRWVVAVIIVASVFFGTEQLAWFLWGFIYSTFYHVDISKFSGASEQRVLNEIRGLTGLMRLLLVAGFYWWHGKDVKSKVIGAVLAPVGFLIPLVSWVVLVGIVRLIVNPGYQIGKASK